MNYKIIEAPAFNTIGKAIRASTTDGENFTQIPLFWGQSKQDGTLDRLAALSSKGDVVEGKLLGICADFAPDMKEFTYMIAAENPGGPVADDLVEKAVPASTWAVFEARGTLPDAIQAVWQQIMGEFFETTDYKHGDAPDLEVYPPGNPMLADYQCEVWVPVVKK